MICDYSSLELVLLALQKLALTKISDKPNVAGELRVNTSEARFPRFFYTRPPSNSNSVHGTLF